MIKLKNIFNDTQTKVFRVLDDTAENELDWLIEPTILEVLEESDEQFILRSVLVVENGNKPCFTNMMMPERINELVVLQENGEALCEYIYDIEGDVIPLVAIEELGEYELYYSKLNPTIGIEVLKDGLNKSSNPYYIALDLGYILRDENRYEEAIEAFLICEKIGVDSEYVFNELAYCYGEMGNEAKQKEYELKFQEAQ